MVPKKKRSIWDTPRTKQETATFESGHPVNVFLFLLDIIFKYWWLILKIYLFAYFLMESSDRSVIDLESVSLNSEARFKWFCIREMRFLENFKEFNGLLTCLPLFDMNSPFPVIKALDYVTGRKLTHQQSTKHWSTIRFVVIEEPSLLQHPFIQRNQDSWGRYHLLSFLLQKSALQRGAVSVGRPAISEASCHARGFSWEDGVTDGPPKTERVGSRGDCR